MSAADEAPGVGHLPCAHVWPLQMRSRRQRGLLSQQRPDQLADYSGCAPGEVLGGRARVDGLLDVVALPPLAGMSAAVVRVGAAPSSTRARAPLKSFAMVPATAPSEALVELWRIQLWAERRVVPPLVARVGGCSRRSAGRPSSTRWSLARETERLDRYEIPLHPTSRPIRFRTGATPV